MPRPVQKELIEKQLPKLAEQDGTTIEQALNNHILAKQWTKYLLEPSKIGATAITGEVIGVTGGMEYLAFNSEKYAKNHLNTLR